jgi:Myosin N-terminal SH3-like domain
VWAEDPVEAWIDGEVVEINGDEIFINNSGERVGSFIKFSFPSSSNSA